MRQNSCVCRPGDSAAEVTHLQIEAFLGGPGRRPLAWPGRPQPGHGAASPLSEQRRGHPPAAAPQTLANLCSSCQTCRASPAAAAPKTQQTCCLTWAHVTEFPQDTIQSNAADKVARHSRQQTTIHSTHGEHVPVSGSTPCAARGRARGCPARPAPAGAAAGEPQPPAAAPAPRAAARPRRCRQSCCATGAPVHAKQQLVLRAMLGCHFVPVRSSMSAGAHACLQAAIARYMCAGCHS